MPLAVTLAVLLLRFVMEAAEVGGRSYLNITILIPVFALYLSYVSLVKDMGFGGFQGTFIFYTLAVRLSVIRNGLEVKHETIALPYELTWRDVGLNKDEGPVFYRVKVEEDSKNYLVSNPIFVRFREEMPEQVVSISKNTAEVLGKVEPIEPKVQEPQNPTSPSIKAPDQPMQDKIAPTVSKPPEPKSTIETPNLTLPTVKQPIIPLVEIPSPAPAPVMPPVAVQKSVVAKINGVSLKNGPGPRFPEVGRLNKGDSLPLLRNTTIEFNGKPWLMVDADGRKAYVWSELVATE